RAQRRRCCCGQRRRGRRGQAPWLAPQTLRDGMRRAERKNSWSPPIRHSAVLESSCFRGGYPPLQPEMVGRYSFDVTHRQNSREQAVQKPARHSILAAVEALAINPGPHTIAAFDAEIIAGERASAIVTPPRHRDALGPFNMDDVMAHTPPDEL